MKAVISSLFGKLIQKRGALMPGKETHDVLQRERKVNKIQEYYYIKYTLSALTVIAWVTLVLGSIGSLVWGITTGGLAGGLRIALGIIGSFLAWLALLAARELLKLFVDVKKNTRTTAEHITRESD